MSEENSNIKNWIILTCDGAGLPLAMHLKKEGLKVYVGQVQDKTELNPEDTEDPEDKKNRLKLYYGLVRKEPAKKLVKALKTIEDKDSYFIFCDRNYLYPYAEQLAKAGFTKGIFPTKEDYDMEKERENAMSFVEEHYPYVQIIPHEKYKTVEEAKAAVEGSGVPLVIQSEGDFVPTVVGDDDVEQSRKVILSTLDTFAKEYSKGEIIIKEKLVKPVEITPQILFWDGEPVYTSIDIETKYVGDGENNGNQVGCGTNLIIKTAMEDQINQIAFPEKVYELAKKHKGIFIWDISLYFTDSGIFFGEFCSNRFGYDALWSEITMTGSCVEYFTKIANGENPLQSKFGTSIKAFNLKLKEEQEVQVENYEPVWIYDAQLKDDKMVTTGDDWELAAITGKGDTLEDAVDDAYENYKTLTFKEKYTRTKEDFLADYPTSIVNRYNATVGTYFDAPAIAKPAERQEQKVEKVQKEYKSKLDEVKEQLKKIMYGGQGTVQTG